ncbi:Sugar ABC transporter binding protein (Y4oP) [Vibrio nigripulchritudo SOn1]|uniref:Sugar ABC transporter binding protein (Y4oP) n=1 Tax=Vibrio nigripulchritudo SOn1 TaxID=1238450 RepID=A0AAV2VT48_9VIBR|nr:extracellular solute-binding protein [Vibrio nigripulchritudo]CCO47873.1 Sugar ABC transporter binding protein (Y4oP) [Vibrio nigripulchritudo SOn1]
MTKEELIRILSFVESSRTLTESAHPLSSIDPRWNIVAYCVRRHFEGKLITVTSLAIASNVPYATAMRRINELIDEGMLLKRKKTKTGKSFSIHPTEKMIKQFEAFAFQLKGLVGNTFGFHSNHRDFYFGGAYMGQRTIPYPSVLKDGLGYDRILKILCPSDPTFRTLSDLSSTLNELCGGKLEIVNLALDELHSEIIENAQRVESKYDLIAVDLPWFGEFVSKEMLLPLTSLIEEHSFNHNDFHTAAWRASVLAGEQYGIPIQPTAELLFYRRDVLEELELLPPRTMQGLLDTLAKLNQYQPETYGIILNCGAGTPVAHTFLQILASFGQAVIDLPKVSDDFDVTNLNADNFRPCLDTKEALAAVQCLQSLLKFAHPASLNCDWDKRIRLFSQGKVAFTFGWSIRAGFFELNSESPAYGHVGYCVAPPSVGCKPVSPIGGFSLAIPSNLPKQHIGITWQMMSYLTTPEMMKWYTLNGSFSSPRFSTSADEEVAEFSSVIATVDSLEKKGQVQIWPRIPIPEFSDIIQILGEEIHAILRKVKSPEEGLESAQLQINRLMIEAGRYSE